VASKFNSADSSLTQTISWLDHSQQASQEAFEHKHKELEDIAKYTVMTILSMMTSQTRSFAVWFPTPVLCRYRHKDKIRIVPANRPCQAQRCQECEFFSARLCTSVDTFARIEATAPGESAARARWAVGVEMLYGAFVLVRIWISGGWAMAIPSLRKGMR